MTDTATPRVSERVRRLHHDACVFLSFVSCHFRYLPDGEASAAAFFEDDPRAQGSWPHLERGGVDGMVLSFGLMDGEMFPGRAGVGRMFQMISDFLAEADRRGSRLHAVRPGETPRQVLARGGAPTLLHTTGAYLAGDLDTLIGYRDLGVRVMHPPFDPEHPTDGVGVGKRLGKLSPFGQEVVREMGRLGMVVDVSHAADRAFWEILDAARGPVIASHSNCRSLCDVDRNLEDDQARAIGQMGGVVGVHFASGFIEKAYDDRFRATGFYEKLRAWERDLRRQYPDPNAYISKRINLDDWDRSELHAIELSVPPPPLTMLVDHVDRLVELTGIDHVGVGTDYDLGSMPREVDPADKLPNLTQALLDRGYSEEDTRKIMGENFLRLFEDAARAVR